MGKLILCTGETAQEPFCFPLTNTRVYSLEELCYYIYNNIYNITEDDFNDDLVQWMETQLKMPKTAQKAAKIIKHKGSIKDLVVTILCSGDYYEEKQIKDIIGIMDRLSTMSPLEKKKLRGDNRLFYGDYKNAAKEYQSILKEEGANKLSKKDQGNILHNLGITKFYGSTYEDAAATFLDAYEKNDNPDSLLAWLFAFNMSKGENPSADSISQMAGPEAALNLSGIIKEALEEGKECEGIRGMEQLKELKKAGRVDEYYVKLYGMLSKWKEDYKNGLV